MLFDLLEDLFGDLVVKGIRNVYDHLSDYGLFHPRLAVAGKVLVLLLVAGGGLGWFVFNAWLGWKSGNEVRMWANIAGAVAFLAGISFICVRRLIRWLKKRKETMYDPRYQK